MRTIKVTVKQVYGRDTIYPLDPLFAKIHSTLTGRKTLTELDVKCYITLGFTIETDYHNASVNLASFTN